MIYKDYYKDLGIGKTASAAEIKKAYRSLAKKYHPDKTNGDKSAEEKFKAISEANEVLSDPDKRKKYDQFGSDWKHYEDAGAHPGGFDWSKYANSQNGQTHQSSANESHSEFSDAGLDDFFEMLFKQSSSQRHEKQNRVISGDDLKTETILSLEEAYNGTTRLIELNGQTIKVTIKPGVADGQILRIAGKGRRGLNGGPNGNLYLSVRIAPNSEFRRDGNNLEHDLPVDLYTAVLGGKARVKTLKGKITVNIPKETPNGTELRLRGLGMPIFNKKIEFGDLFVKIFIQIPHSLSQPEIDLFRKLAALRN